jgi:ribosomal protein S27E
MNDMTTRVQVECPDCSESYTVKAEQIGKRASCRGCGARFVLRTGQTAHSLAPEARRSSEAHSRRVQVPSARMWYQDQSGHEVGPMSVDELRRLAYAGDIQPDTMVRKSEHDEWVRSDRMKQIEFYTMWSWAILLLPAVAGIMTALIACAIMGGGISVSKVSFTHYDRYGQLSEQNGSARMKLFGIPILSARMGSPGYQTFDTTSNIIGVLLLGVGGLLGASCAFVPVYRWNCRRVKNRRKLAPA